MLSEQAKNSKVVYLTTKGRRTGKPHTVEIWFAHENGVFYLSHEGDYTDWMKNLVKNNDVTLKVANEQLVGKARILTDASEKDQAKKALYFKYYGPASDAVLEDWFELSILLEVRPKSEETES
ncbi:MAG: nitroreductase family deazaflavin-dependent oxidoreductase [Candidatus Bathyarchaeia archaeon]